MQHGTMTGQTTDSALYNVVKLLIFNIIGNVSTFFIGNVYFWKIRSDKNIAIVYFGKIV